MPYTIHLDQQATSQVISAMRLSSDRMYDMASSLFYHVAQADWQCSAREDFVDELFGITRQLRQLCDQLDALAFQVALKTEQWVESDTHFSSKYNLL